MAFRPGFWPPIMASRVGYHEDLDDDDEDLIESSPSPLSQVRVPFYLKYLIMIS